MDRLSKHHDQLDISLPSAVRSFEVDMPHSPSRLAPQSTGHWASPIPEKNIVREMAFLGVSSSERCFFQMARSLRRETAYAPRQGATTDPLLNLSDFHDRDGLRHFSDRSVGARFVTGINSRVGHDPIREVIEGEIVRKTPVWGTPSGARL